jgi:rod shape-determining protein MreD
MALLAVAALAQVTWAPRFEVLGAFPNLVLLAVVTVAWTLGPRGAMVWACAGGLLLDLTSAGPIGPHALALLPGVYAIGFWTRNVERPTWPHVALTAAAATLPYSVVLVLADDLLGLYAPSPGVVAALALAAAAYNGVLAPLVFEVLRRFQARPQPTA